MDKWQLLKIHVSCEFIKTPIVDPITKVSNTNDSEHGKSDKVSFKIELSKKMD